MRAVFNDQFQRDDLTVRIVVSLVKSANGNRKCVDPHSLCLRLRKSGGADGVIERLADERALYLSLIHI